MYQRGNRWYSDFYYKGERYVKSHGPVSKSVAKDKDRNFKEQVASGNYIRERNNLPFSKAMDQHLKKSLVENAGSSPPSVPPHFSI